MRKVFSDYREELRRRMTEAPKPKKIPSEYVEILEARRRKVIAQEEPWLKEGISRRTWYRRKAKERKEWHDKRFYWDLPTRKRGRPSKWLASEAPWSPYFTFAEYCLVNPVTCLRLNENILTGKRLSTAEAIRKIRSCEPALVVYPPRYLEQIHSRIRRRRANAWMAFLATLYGKPL